MELCGFVEKSICVLKKHLKKTLKPEKKRIPMKFGFLFMISNFSDSRL